MRTSHILAALLLSALAAAASPANAVPDGSARAAITESAPSRTAATTDDADVARYSARQRRDAAKVQHFEGGDRVIVIATSTTVLIIAVVLLIIFI